MWARVWVCEWVSGASGASRQWWPVIRGDPPSAAFCWWQQRHLFPVRDLGQERCVTRAERSLLTTRRSPSKGLIFKMLRRNHPQLDFTIISRICVGCIEWTYEQKTRVRFSFRCEIYESQMILNLRATEWFQLSACKRLLINVINIYNINLEQRAARTAYIFKNLQYSDNKKCVRLLRPWRDAKHFSTSKAVFINMSAGVDLSARTL